MTKAPQNYANHVHQPWLWITGTLLWLAATILIARGWYGGTTSHAGLMLLVGAVCCSLAIGRVYITKLQDRIIRLEMRVRCARFLSPAQLESLERLSMKQLVALRFASDPEIPALLERAHKERLSPTQIKKAVVNWVPDYDRT